MIACDCSGKQVDLQGYRVETHTWEWDTLSGLEPAFLKVDSKLLTLKVVDKQTFVAAQHAP